MKRNWNFIPEIRRGIERSAIFREEAADGRATVTTSEERVLLSF